MQIRQGKDLGEQIVKSGQGEHSESEHVDNSKFGRDCNFKNTFSSSYFNIDVDDSNCSWRIAFDLC